MVKKTHFAMKQHKTRKERPLNYVRPGNMKSIEKIGNELLVHEFLRDEKKLALSYKGDQTEGEETKTKGRKTSKKTLRKSSVMTGYEKAEDAKLDDDDVLALVDELLADETTAPSFKTLSRREKRLAVQKQKDLADAAEVRAALSDESASTVDSPAKKSTKEAKSVKVKPMKKVTEKKSMKTRVKQNNAEIGDLWSADMSKVAVGKAEKEFVTCNKFKKVLSNHNHHVLPSGRIDSLTLVRAQEPQLTVPGGLTEVATLEEGYEDAAGPITGPLRSVKLCGDEAIVSNEDNRLRRHVIPSEHAHTTASKMRMALAAHKYKVKYTSPLFVAYRDGLLKEKTSAKER